MDIFIKNGVIKKKEEVMQDVYKKNFNTEWDNKTPGPYYDPTASHVHVFKNVSLIKNFRGEQKPSESKIKKCTTNRPTVGLFCTICHIRKTLPKYNLRHECFVIGTPYKKRKDENELVEQIKKLKIAKRNTNVMWDRLYILVYKNHVAKYRNIYDSVIAIKTKEQNIIWKWSRFTSKLMETPVYYPLSPFKSILIKPSDMTNYQFLKYKYPNYKTEVDFIIYNNKFDTNYILIEK